ncbi:MAG: isoleucine--tRNA ligase [Exiguobacterium sp.]|uniref:Isoleucine--tRNA ligase n=1 Tax=Exiguobacterium alkaliphilum TaxID=1428684 RepID=A0ABT2L160_9BACL|nr:MULTISPECIES: isoleucine--tRNA ligase [Exiguobacterium]MDX5322831.1 isoleucine--tRNA ligase [Exiguobacterium sp.]KDN58879.1 isoleucine--tRNA ligase [Exiguobacterium sp. AB2]MCT4796454.1 isoleucine--tRNA ligase [Exiguobacterium alkaliphilum]MDX5424577.1 isoleucine--tRNA ligase [Exiguobacterium sp.]MDX6772074.1 isoleucine--tRNA ligase [Exiguobacterium sp.]
MNYKDTLLMPETDFAMRGNLPKREPQMQEAWEQMDLYNRVLEKNAGKPQYILHDGPPYANGDIHMGHALNKVLKDIIVRFKSLNGYQSPMIPGWDTHGLPIENALQKAGVNRKEMTVAEFREKCAAYAMEQVNSQREQFKRLGLLADFENPYITLLPEYEAAQIRLFGTMAEKGYIYKGKKPVYWSPSSESALAEAEIEYYDKKSPAIYVAFQVVDGKGVLDTTDHFVIWTTTPWTIPANLGIAVSNELTYTRINHDGKGYIVAESLVEDVTTALGWTDFTVDGSWNGQAFEHMTAQHPLYDRTSLVMIGDHVTADATGLVHTAPGHGEDDYRVGQAYGLDVLCPVDDRGYMTDEAPGFEGLFYEDANKQIGMKLEENGYLLNLKFIKHSYPHDWRTKKPVIFRATPQWFASIKDFRSDLLREIEEVNWVPEWGMTRLYNMVRDRGDWVISRQRAWGVPIPIFYAEDGTEIITNETIDHVANLFREHGSNVWYEREAKDLLPAGFTHPNSPNGEFRKELDIMDVWFDSGSSHAGVLEERANLRRPADLYLEGSDQYRGWFNSSLSTAVATTGKAPYRTVLSHGFVLDGDGRKMSKSLGNTIAPNDLVKQYGAEIVRLWVSSVDYQSDVRASHDNFKQVSEVYRKIRNTLRFLLGNLNGFDPSMRVAFEDMPEADQFMATKLKQLQAKVIKAYDTFDFMAVYHLIHNFCVNELSSFYLDFTKDILYIEREDDARRRAVQTVMYDTVIALTKLIAPILPHTADEVWQEIPAKAADSVFLSDLDEVVALSEEETALLAKWSKFLTFRNDVLKAIEIARGEKLIGKPLEAKLLVAPKGETKALLETIDNVRQLLQVSQLDYVAHADVDYATAEITVTKADGAACARCWTYSTELGQHAEHPELCPRCTEVIA